MVTKNAVLWSVISICISVALCTFAFAEHEEAQAIFLVCCAVLSVAFFYLDEEV